jgi:hypothetical protein
MKSRIFENASQIGPVRSQGQNSQSELDLSRNPGEGPPVDRSKGVARTSGYAARAGMAIDTIVGDLDARRLHKTTDFLTVLLGLVKIDLRVWVSSTRRQEMLRQLAVEAGARQVFRPGCGPAGRGRSVHSCTGSPSLEGQPRPPQSLGSVAGPIKRLPSTGTN